MHVYACPHTATNNLINYPMVKQLPNQDAELIALDDFLFIIDKTPLIAIDLIIKNEKNNILLGLRNNKPAQGCWFVPGGRIRKNESIRTAFSRICESEIGIRLDVTVARLIGVYEHFYDDCISNDATSTHYIVLAYELTLEHTPIPSDNQHSEYKWFKMVDLLCNHYVHDYTKAYFHSLESTE